MPDNQPHLDDAPTPLAIRIDHTAPAGELISVLARLLRRLRDSERGEYRSASKGKEGRA